MSSSSSSSSSSTSTSTATQPPAATTTTPATTGEEEPRRSLLGPLSSFFSPKRSSSPKKDPTEQPTQPLPAAPAAVTAANTATEVSDTYIRKQVYSVEEVKEWLNKAHITGLHGLSKVSAVELNVLPFDGDKELLFCSRFYVIRSTSSPDPGRILSGAPIPTLKGSGHTTTVLSATGGSSSSGGTANNNNSSASPSPSPSPTVGDEDGITSPITSSIASQANIDYIVGQNTYLFNQTQVSASALRDQLMASEATMARLQAEAAGAAGKESQTALKVLHLLKEFFVEVPGYKYELGAISHKWAKVKGLEPKVLRALAGECERVMAAEPTLLRIDPPVYVIGDLHGNFKDFSYFAKAFGLWSSAEFTPAKFLFLGDYVDRGLHSIETLAFVLALKVRFPEKVFLLRGNHECAEINGDEDLYQSGSFRRQCTVTYGRREGVTLWERFNACFEQMPLAAVIDNKIFCVHAGIPRCVSRCPDVPILDTIAGIQRPPNLDDDQVFDLIWADPATPAEEKRLGKKGFPEGFGPNTRGPATCVFGKKAVEMFCKNSGCSHLIRAHQSSKLGVDIAKGATILTVFSSSHYCGGFNRAAAVLVHDHKLDIIVSNPNVSDSPNVFSMNEDYMHN